MRLFAAVLLAFAAFAAPAAAADCPAGARCGKIDVPVDRSGAVPGTFPIAYATLPATGPRVGTVFFLAGGPGEAAIVYTTALKTELAPIRAAYDIVVVDQRGTGRSGEIECNPLAGDDVAKGCAKELGKRRAFLTTKETARDLDDLRAALGLEKIVPLGVSYGTKVAGEYARRFPERTAAVVLDSPTGVGPIDLMFLQGIAAAPRVLREACATGPCAESVKDAATALYAAVERVGGRGLRATLGPGELAEKTRIKEDFVLNALLLGDADAGLRADLPAALVSLSRGDTAPATHLLERLIVAYAQAPDADSDEEDVPTEDFSSGTSRYLATACLEAALPWATTSAPATRRAARRDYIQRLGPAAFAPFKPSTVWKDSPLDLCLNWPATAAPEPVPDAGPDVPVLVLSGRADLRTPLELATRVAAAYPRATVLDVPHVGHSVISADRSGCAVRGLQAFLSGAAPAPCTAAPTVAAARYLPVSARGLSATQAARYTVEALLHDLAATRIAAGQRGRYELLGLRGGEATVRKGRLTLRRVAWFRDVRVTGSVSAKTGKGRVTVRGPGKQRRTVQL